MLCIFGLTACGSKKSDEEMFDAETCEQNVEAIISQVIQTIDEETMKQYIALGTDELDTIMMNNGLPMTGDAFRSFLESWIAAKEEGGEFQSLGKWEESVNGNELTLTTTAAYEKRNADFTVIFNKYSKIKSVGIDMKYSTGEILKKAVMNTLLGMGTVFVVLIIISLIISCFGLVAKVQNGMGKGTTAGEAAAVPPEAVAEGIGIPGDLELAAVIAAAIAAAEGTSADSFVVRSIKKRNTSKWKRA